MIARSTEQSVTMRRRIDNTLRFAAAVPIGYAVSSLWGAALARLLPMEPSEATVTGTLVALLLCAFTVMYAYGARSGWRATWILLLLGTIAATITWSSIAVAGRT